jgi:hypothetical protein
VDFASMTRRRIPGIQGLILDSFSMKLVTALIMKEKNEKISRKFLTLFCICDILYEL